MYIFGRLNIIISRLRGDTLQEFQDKYVPYLDWSDCMKIFS